jgi:hypothetical protein
MIFNLKKTHKVKDLAQGNVVPIPNQRIDRVFYGKNNSVTPNSPVEAVMVAIYHSINQNSDIHELFRCEYRKDKSCNGGYLSKYKSKTNPLI